MADKPIKRPGFKRISFEEFAEAILGIKFPKYLPKILKKIKYSENLWLGRGFDHGKPLKHPTVEFSKLPELWTGVSADIIIIDEFKDFEESQKDEKNED